MELDIYIKPDEVYHVFVEGVQDHMIVLTKQLKVQIFLHTASFLKSVRSADCVQRDRKPVIVRESINLYVIIFK